MLYAAFFLTDNNFKVRRSTGTT